MTPRRRALIEALRDPAEAVRARATEALDRLDLLDGMPNLVPRLRSFGKVEWLKLLGSLVGRRDEMTLKLGLKALEHPDEEVRLAALDLAEACGDARACPVLSLRLSDPAPLVRGRAAWALGRLGDRRRGEEVAALLDDPDPRPLASAAEALGLLDHTPSEPRLLALLQHHDPEVRACAAEALGRMGAGAAPP